MHAGHAGRQPLIGNLAMDRRGRRPRTRRRSAPFPGRALSRSARNDTRTSGTITRNAERFAVPSKLCAEQRNVPTD